MPGRQVKVLIVEDNPGDVVLVREALTQAQVAFELTVQDDGESMLHLVEALEQQGGPFPDVVVLDLNLPRVGGLQLLARMRKSAAWSAVPVIIASSAGAPSDRQAAAKLGISDYFRKPADLEQFMEIGTMVRRAVGN
jgi:DNA-binding response OmpR family regulator